jgi:hypothetical protein
MNTNTLSLLAHEKKELESRLRRMIEAKDPRLYLNKIRKDQEKISVKINTFMQWCLSPGLEGAVAPLLCQVLSTFLHENLLSSTPPNKDGDQEEAVLSEYVFSLVYLVQKKLAYLEELRAKRASLEKKIKALEVKEVGDDVLQPYLKKKLPPSEQAILDQCCAQLSKLAPWPDYCTNVSIAFQFDDNQLEVASSLHGSILNLLLLLMLKRRNNLYKGSPRYRKD